MWSISAGTIEFKCVVLLQNPTIRQNRITDLVIIQDRDFDEVRDRNLMKRRKKTIPSLAGDDFFTVLLLLFLFFYSYKF